jgi:hypothetical protein
VIGQAVYSGGEETRQYHVAGDGTMDHFAVFLTSNTRSDTSTLYLRLNGARTALSITIPAGATGWFYGTGGPIAVVAGDLINYEADISVGSGSYHQSSTEIDFISTTGQITGGLGQTVRTYSGGDAHYPLTGATNTITYDDEVLMDFTINAIEIYITSNARTVDSYIVLEVNGVDVITGTIPVLGTGWFSGVGTAVLRQGDIVAVYIRGAASGVQTFGFTIIDWWGAQAAPPTGTIVVVKNVQVGGSTSTTFPITVTGPSGYSGSASLADGDSASFPVPAGAGYGVTETLPTPDWTQVSAVVDNGDPIDDIDVDDGETVTVTFTNASARDACLLNGIVSSDSGGGTGCPPDTLTAASSGGGSGCAL